MTVVRAQSITQKENFSIVNVKLLQWMPPKNVVYMNINLTGFMKTWLQ